MFYNTGITTYIGVLTNRKPAHRKGKVQLIDATSWYKPLRKNLGKKNCELAGEDIDRIIRTFIEFKETEESKIFDNDAFGYCHCARSEAMSARSARLIRRPAASSQ
jgi:type I restriction enzyme M protein